MIIFPVDRQWRYNTKRQGHKVDNCMGEDIWSSSICLRHHVRAEFCCAWDDHANDSLGLNGSMRHTAMSTSRLSQGNSRKGHYLYETRSDGFAICTSSQVVDAMNAHNHIRQLSDSCNEDIRAPFANHNSVLSFQQSSYGNGMRNTIKPWHTRSTGFLRYTLKL